MNCYKNLIKKQKTYFQTNITREVPFRLDALQKLRTSIKLHEKELMEALKADLNKSDFESYSTEIGVVLEEIRFAMRHLNSWTRPKKVKTPLTHIGSNPNVKNGLKKIKMFLK